MSCRGIMNIGPTWKNLIKTVDDSEYTLTKDHQWLEHHVNLETMDEEKIRLDLYCPIKE